MVNLIDFLGMCGLFLLSTFLFLSENYKNDKLEKKLKELENNKNG